MASVALNTTNPALLVAKLGALVRDIGVSGVPLGAPGGGGAATRHEDVAYVLHAPENGIRSLGPALLWTARAGLEQLVLFSDSHAGDLARRAKLFDAIEISVREVVGASSNLAPATALVSPPVLSPKVMALSETLASAGTTPVEDFGRLVGEVAGLEVVRATGGDSGSVTIGVGVGQADRELHELVHSNLETSAAIARAAAMVAPHRQPGAPAHPLNRLARGRWLRAIAVDDPSAVGVGVLNPVPPLRASATVLENDPPAALSDSAVVVFSDGVDPDLVPEALEYRQRHGSQLELVLAIAAKDRLPTIDRLIALCRDTRVVAIPSPWL